MNLSLAHARLIALLREKVRNGEVTERGFARMVGISQPHIHKVLKGTRTLSIDYFDLILKRINHSVLDLCSETDLSRQFARLISEQDLGVDLPFEQSRLGPGSSWRPGVRREERHPVPVWAAESRPWCALARLERDWEMEFSDAGLNIAVLNTAIETGPPLPEAVYAVDRPHDTVLRRVRLGRGRLYLVSDARRTDPLSWEFLAFPARNPLAAIRGRAVWLGREGERAFPGRGEAFRVNSQD